ncbi:MAG: GNAT family N-acetyltransferase [Burkholderiales bacterium]|nr:GNAT family N-acetyltransferase [Burkholderiales bacterium]
MKVLPTPPILDDGQVRLRLAGIDDVPAIVRYYSDNRAALKPFEPNRGDAFYTEPFWQARVVSNRSQFDQGTGACLFLFEPDDKTVVGTINISNVVGYPLHGALLGYSLARSHWGRGRMHQALTMALGWAFDHFNLHRIAANHLPDNERSARVLASLGFVREGYAANYLLIDGAWRDHVLNALTAKQWQARDYTRELVINGTGMPASD